MKKKGRIKEEERKKPQDTKKHIEFIIISVKSGRSVVPGEKGERAGRWSDRSDEWPPSKRTNRPVPPPASNNTILYLDKSQPTAKGRINIVTFNDRVEKKGNKKWTLFSRKEGRNWKLKVAGVSSFRPVVWSVSQFVSFEWFYCLRKALERRGTRRRTRRRSRRAGRLIL